MKIIVTGGAGFIGSHAVDALIESGHEILVIDNLSSGRRENVRKGAAFHEADIQDGEMKRLFSDFSPDAVAHFAAQIDVRKSVANPVDDAKINILGSLNVIEAARACGCRKIIFSSTGGAIYGDTDVVPTPESHEAFPVSPYGVAKLSFERYMHYYGEVHGISYTALRFANVYGERQNAKGEAGVVSIFADIILGGGVPKIYGDGTQTRDYVYVKDVARAVALALEKNISGIYNVGTGRETDVNYLSDLVAKALEFHGNFEYAPPRQGEQKRSALDYSKIRDTLQWEPKVALEVGIPITCEWFREGYRA